MSHVSQHVCQESRGYERGEGDRVEGFIGLILGILKCNLAHNLTIKCGFKKNFSISRNTGQEMPMLTG